MTVVHDSAEDYTFVTDVVDCLMVAVADFSEDIFYITGERTEVIDRRELRSILAFVIDLSGYVVYLTDAVEEAGGVMSPARRYVELHCSCLADECPHVFCSTSLKV